MTESPQKITVSHTEVEAYLKCERQHFYGYGLEIQRREISDALFRGTIGHAAMETAYNLILKGEELKDAKQAALDYVIATAFVRPEIMAELIKAIDSFFESYPFKGWTILAVEQEYVLSVNEDQAMPFVIDLLIQDPYGDNWLIDNKFVYNFYTDRDVELLPQLPKYYVGLQAAGVPVNKMAYACFRYRQQKDQHADKYFLLKPVIINNNRILRTLEEQVVIADRIQKIKQQSLEDWSGTAMRIANNMVCGKCSFRSLCVAELNDEQPNLILQTDYMPRERREFKVSEND